MSSSSGHSTFTYTFDSDVSRPSFGIPLVDVYGYESDAYEAASQSPEHAPLSSKHAPPADDNLEPAEAQTLPAPVSPVPLSPDYSTDIEPIEDDPSFSVVTDLEDLEEPQELPLSTSSVAVLIGESLAAAAVRQPGSTLAQGTRDRLMVALKETNERVTNLGTRYMKDSYKMYARDQDAQDNMAVLRARIASLKRDARYLRTRVVTSDQENAYT
ncbi:hypothetical protein Tco_1461452 [Tanacetum coccineum]